MFIRSLLSIVLTLFTCISIVKANPPETADLDGFRKTVAPFLKTYCVECHSGKAPDGDLNLTELDPDIFKGRDFETWRIVEERLRFGEMPPKEWDQPKKRKCRML